MIRRMIVFGAALALAACHSRPVNEHPLPAASAPATPVEAVPPSTAADDANPEQPAPANLDTASNASPCLPEVAKPRAAAKRRPRATQGMEKSAAVETQPPRLGSATPEVKSIDASVGSILGKKIEGSDGEDLGRVVDVQADGNGRVRLVIIEFGGFLGVGNRRAAIDWGLLRFHPDDPEQPLTLAVGAKEVLATPEYRQSSHPKALMAPATPPQTK